VSADPNPEFEWIGPCLDHPIRIAYRDTDQMGFVYYANFLAFMEIGRVELLRARGWTYREMEESGVFLPVLRAECDYVRPARYDDLLRVRTYLTEATRLRLNFRYEIFCDAREELVAAGATQHVFMGRDEHAVRVSHEVLSRIRGSA
jgi:acyl-CoA thioester hydrolase